MKIFINIKLDRSGTTLMELIVAVAIFTVLMIMTGSIFLSISQGQRTTIAGQIVQENMKFLLEVISKELRSASKSSTAVGGKNCEIGGGTPIANRIYNIDVSAGREILYFLDKDNDCVYYEVDGGAFKIEREGDLVVYDVTPNELVLSNLDFEVVDNALGYIPGDKVQPMVTIKFDVEYNTAKETEKQATTFQTTISSRYYD